VTQLQPQRAEPLYQQVYRILRQQIIQGEFAPGEILLESRLAELLSVSRTPVREALRQLVSERLIVARGSELSVADPSRQEFTDLCTCRAALEKIVVERAARLASAEDIEQMEAALNDANEAIVGNEHTRVFEANTKFHDHMVRASQMPLLSDLLENLRGPILIARRHILANSPEIEKVILQEHIGLLDAIRDRNVELAQELMKKHMQNDLDRGLSNFQS
jgi:GntR family transcriptional regulator, rspAB operon transcriptional repressor